MSQILQETYEKIICYLYDTHIELNILYFYLPDMATRAQAFSGFLMVLSNFLCWSESHYQIIRTYNGIGKLRM